MSIDFKSQTCCFTGHRAIPQGEEAKILARVKSRIDKLILDGVLYFGVGGALGFDTMMAEYLIERRKRNSRIKIIEVLPFPEYRSKWTGEQKQRASVIDAQMDKIVYCYDENSREAYLGRDRHLVDCSDYCISYCTRNTGGTAYTVRYALKKGLSVWNMSSFDIKSLK